jgi:hypothetical protein
MCGALEELLSEDLSGLPFERRMTGVLAVLAGPGGRVGKPGEFCAEAKEGEMGEEGEFEARGKGTGAERLRVGWTALMKEELGDRCGERGGDALEPVAGVRRKAGGWRRRSGGGGPSSSSTGAGAGGSSLEEDESSSLASPRKWNLRGVEGVLPLAGGEWMWERVRRGSMPKLANAPGPARGSSTAKV